MKVKELKTGAVMQVNDSFASRMIEQGKAVVVRELKKPTRKTARIEEKPEEVE